MKTQHLENQNLADWPLRAHLAGINQSSDSSGHPLGWIERTLLAVDTNRVFIEVADPRLREELAAEYEAENRDVIAASDSDTLLNFMEQLPIPAEPTNDIVIVENDFPKTTATELRCQLKARGWEIPVFTVWNQSSSGGKEVAS
jgi:hypothetical protein